MLQTIAQKTVYKGFGLHILSDFPLPELPESERNKTKIDIVFQLRNLTEEWAKLSLQHNQHYVADENMIMFQIPNVAIYLIQDGCRVFVSPAPGSSQNHVRLFLLGTCMGALLLQRRILPLHGSAIVINGNAYAIVGDSGAGKSTLASAFLQKGFQLISDDIIPVSFNTKNLPIVTPAYPQQKLWQESLQAFGMASDDLRPIVDREDKFAVPVHTQFVGKPLPLAGIFELVKTDDEIIEFEPLRSLQGLHTLFYHTYRNVLLAPSGLMQWHFSFTTKLLNHIQLLQIRRPISSFTAHELTKLIIEKINEEE